MGIQPTVFVVDDDQAVCMGLKLLIESAGFLGESYSSGQEFLDSYESGRPGCLVLDIRMPGMNGLELQDELAANGIDIPIIFITGHGDIPMAVRAIQNGACDFLEKPFRGKVLLNRIRQAIQCDTQSRNQRANRFAVEKCLSTLTPRERQVMDLVIAGKANKQIATELGVSVKAIEAHRARTMNKMQVDSLAELIRVVLTVNSV